MIRAGVLATIAGLVAPCMTASAQDQSVDDRLREALRKATVELRAAQDAQATLQATLDQAQKQRDLLQQQVVQLTAQLAQKQEAPPPAPAPAAPPSGPDQAQLQSALDDAHKQIDELHAGMAHWQTAYQQAAVLAQQKDALSRQLDTKSQASSQMLAACSAKNAKLIAVAEDILHLYSTQDFQTLLVKSYEPVLGLWKVRLENIVQDNDDRIQDQRYYPGERQAPAARSQGAAQ
jgi:hypothetical protein